MKAKFDLTQLQNVSEIDVVYRKKVRAKMSDRPTIIRPSDCYNAFLHYWNPDTIELVEEFKVLYLNQSNRLLYAYNASMGGITATVADPRIILAIALKVASSKIVLGHNHPSGNLKPSKSDIALTLKLKVAASYHDIEILDHIIVTSEKFLSFASEGLL
ncbi:MAG: JAB domain-containing protein [Chitinophagaceae bacterium]